MPLLTAHAVPTGALPQAVTRKVRILDVKYNASNNELVSSSAITADPSCSSYIATAAALLRGADAAASNDNGLDVAAAACGHQQHWSACMHHCCSTSTSSPRRPSSSLPHALPPCLQVRTQTLVKGCIVEVDAAPFKQWYQQHYGVEVGQKKKAAAAAPAEAEAASQSNHVKRKLKQRNQVRDGGGVEGS